jgi:uncharacterized protein (DUF2147 family)
VTLRRLLQCLMLGALSLLPATNATAAAPDTAPPPILGRWLTQPRDGIIEITTAADGSYQGKIIGGNSPERTDAKNPDASKRSATLLGQIILQRLKLKTAGHWADGTIYDPDSGHTYDCSIEQVDADHLKVRGFFGVSLLGKSQLWTRYTGATLLLPPAQH